MKIRLSMITAVAAAICFLSLGLTACKKAPVERTAAESQEDQKLSEQVKLAFNASQSFKFPDVQVASFKGTVQLSGFVVSADQKTAAEALAKTVAGVQSVENEISLKR